MTLYNYIQTIKIIILNQFLENTLQMRVIFCLLLVIVIMLFFKYYNTIIKPLTIESLKTKIWFDLFFYVLTLFIYIFIYLVALFYFRFLSLGNTFDLKTYTMLNLKKIKEVPLTELFAHIFVFIVFFIVIIILFKICQRIIYRNILKLHFYIISKSKMHLLEQTIYDKIRFKIFQKVYLKIILFPVKFLHFLKNFNKTPTKLYMMQHNAFDVFLASSYKFFGLFLAILFIVYDLIFNNFILHKIFYLLPFLLLYQLLLLFVDFIDQIFLKEDEYDIACYLFVELITEKDTILLYKNGHVTQKENLIRIHNLFKNDFNYSK